MCSHHILIRQHPHSHTYSEYAIVRRLHFIFGRALKKFKTDVLLWMQYFQFCKDTGSTRRLGKAFATYAE